MATYPPEPTSASADPVDPPASRRPGRRRARLLGCATAFVAAVLVLALVVVLGLRTPFARDAIRDRLGDAAARFGVRLEASELRLQPERGVFVLEEVRAYRLGDEDADAAPFLTAASFRGRFVLLSLLGRRLVIDSLELVEPVYDLGAPGPAEHERREGGGGVEIGRVTIVDGTLLSAPGTFGDTAWLRSWSLHGVDVEGVFGAEALRVEIRDTRVEAEREDGGRLQVTAAADLVWPAVGPLRLERLTAGGKGLELEATAEIGDAPDGPFAVTLVLDADAALLAPGVEPAGTLHAEGDVDLRHWTGAVTLRAEDFPVRILRPWVGPEALAKLGAVGTVLDAEGRIDLGE